MKEPTFTKREANLVKGYLKYGLETTSAIDDKLYEMLYESMPYGIAKARTGDPMEWIFNYFARMDENQIDDWIDNRTEVSN